MCSSWLTSHIKHRIKAEYTVPVTMCVLVGQLCPNLCDPMDSSLPSSSVHGILPARILEWVAISFSRRSS